MNLLSKYKKKRDVKKSGEPKAVTEKTKGALKSVRQGGARTSSRPSVKKDVNTGGKKKIYVIHEHHASHHHWDLRLEIRGVLKSWAVPKQPPRSKGIKRLAIQVEDHPMGYADFEGEIPKGQYGAGKVEIWDKGDLQILELDKEKIEFQLRGKKLDGRYVLVNAKLSGEKKNWLFFRAG